MSAIALAVHLLAAAVWIGGMFFAHQVLRPAAAEGLELPVRLALWQAVLWRFFPWVKGSIILLFFSGFWLLRGLGGMANAHWNVHLMLLLAVPMTGVFFVVRGKYFVGLRHSIEAANWQQAGADLAKIRQAMGWNLLLGLVIVALAGAGRYLG